MLFHLDNFELPAQLRLNTISVSSQGLPYLWPIVYQDLFLGQLAASTQRRKLRSIDQFYSFIETNFDDNFDTVISNPNEELLSQYCISYFSYLNNSDFSQESQNKNWSVVFEFISKIFELITRNTISSYLFDLNKKILNILVRYKDLRIKKIKKHEPIRSVPSLVIDLYDEILTPRHPKNPFKNIRAQWTTFIAYVMLLHLGLRRSELLLLPVDCVKYQKNYKDNSEKYWINIGDFDASTESRSNMPSIKNSQSYRQIPISKTIATLIQIYIEGYRGKANHGFLLNSLKCKPLSAETLNKSFRKIFEKIPNELKDLYMDSTLNESITPHGLRHTAVVVRLSHLVNSGEDMQMALEQLRPFFGWSRNSNMPLRYAKAIFIERYEVHWCQKFDQRLDYIRGIK
ncbi:site-specific integrase [Acinetobacter dispersus]|uniref:tyrosine-type recombinase/integrase n=1 Tax=Acinetobacter dispersus TaxID=70348 RepID=UPI003009BFE0